MGQGDGPAVIARNRIAAVIPRGGPRRPGDEWRQRSTTEQRNKLAPSHANSLVTSYACIWSYQMIVTGVMALDKTDRRAKA